LTAGPKTLLVYADGSCLGNPGPGGWGVVIVEPDGTARELSGSDPATTNNRMEITAAIEALRAVPRTASVILRSDSEYLIKTITLGWKRNKNLDLWRALDAELAGRNIRLEWVRGHADDPLNARADELALGAARAGVAGNARAAEPAPASGSSAPQPASLPTPLSAAEQDLARRLTPTLRRGEALRRCAGCGRLFVGAATADKGAQTYCALAECQLKARC